VATVGGVQMKGMFEDAYKRFNDVMEKVQSGELQIDSVGLKPLPGSDPQRYEYTLELSENQQIEGDE